MRITCVISTLGGGGAERVMTYLCEGLAGRGHHVTLLTLDTSTPDFYTLPACVHRERIHLPPFKSVGVLGGFLRLVRMTRALRRTRPEVVISFMAVNVLAAALLLRVPYIYADHLDVRHTPFSRKWQILRNYFLSRASRVVVLSKRDLEFIRNNHPSWKPVVIYNPALPCSHEKLPRPAFMQTDKKYVIAVGRLVAQKGFERLLRAWYTITSNFPQWRLAIIGAGPDEQALRTQIAGLNISASAALVAPIKGLQAVYQHADLLAMSSRTEGFPMVLLEAMAAGVPVVSFNCTGPDVIVRHGVDGLLVPQDDIAAFANALAVLMKEDEKCRSLGERAREVTERFSLSNYIDAYEGLCEDATCKKRLKSPL